VGSLGDQDNIEPPLRITSYQGDLTTEALYWGILLGRLQSVQRVLLWLARFSTPTKLCW